MDIKQAVYATLSQADFIVNAYLGDLKQEELLVRPVPNVNPIAWQLGHLITSEWYLMEAVAKGKMDPLPAGFDEKYGRMKTASDNPADYLSKEEYLRVARQVRNNVLRVVESLPLSTFDEPATGVPPLVKTKGETLLLLGGHWLMHAGQWAVTRRKLGRPPLF